MPTRPPSCDSSGRFWARGSVGHPDPPRWSGVATPCVLGAARGDAWRCHGTGFGIAGALLERTLHWRGFADVNVWLPAPPIVDVLSYRFSGRRSDRPGVVHRPSGAICMRSVRSLDLPHRWMIDTFSRCSARRAVLLAEFLPLSGVQSPGDDEHYRRIL